MLKRTNRKIVATGSIVEVYQYKTRPLEYGYPISYFNKQKKVVGVFDQGSENRKLEARKRAQRRSGSRIRRLVNSNAGQWRNPAGVLYIPILVTLTFKDDIRDVKKANTRFSNFIRRLNYRVSGGSKQSILKYVATVGFQDLKGRGAVHYHAVFFNLPIGDTNTISQAWKQGEEVDVKEIDNIRAVGFYISRNESPRGDDPRLDKCKQYFTSRGLLQPIVMRDQRNAQAVEKLIPRKYIPDTDEFFGYQGLVGHSSYELDQGETLFDIIPDLNNYL